MFIDQRISEWDETKTALYLNKDVQELDFLKHENHVGDGSIQN